MYAISCYLDHVITGPDSVRFRHWGVYWDLYIPIGSGVCSVNSQCPGTGLWKWITTRRRHSVAGREIISVWLQRPNTLPWVICRYEAEQHVILWYESEICFFTENLVFEFSPEGPVDNNSVLIQVMVWRRTEQATSHAKFSYAYKRHSISIGRT